MAERAPAGARDAEPRAAVGIGAGDVGVGGHPVVRMRLALLRRQQGQQRGEGIHRERLGTAEYQVLALHHEPVARPVAADHRPAGGHHFDPQVVELKGIVAIRCGGYGHIVRTIAVSTMTLVHALLGALLACGALLVVQWWRTHTASDPASLHWPGPLHLLIGVA